MDLLYNILVCGFFLFFFIFYFLCFNATFNNISAISWRPVLVVEEAGVPGENHRPWASNWYTLSLATASRVHPFSSPGQRPGELLASVVRHKLSHLNLLLRNHWANCSQTLVDCPWMAPFQHCLRWSRLPTNMAAMLKIEILIVHFCLSISQNELKF